MDSQQFSEFYQSLTTLYAEHNRIYMVLDASSDDSIYPQILEQDLQHGCLFKGEMQSVAPYLMEIKTSNPYSQEWLQSIITKRWGLILISPVSFERLYKHLRHCLMIKHYDGEMIQFRFYDAYHLEPWLRAASAEQQQKFFGPISVIIGHAPDSHKQPKANSKKPSAKTHYLYQLSIDAETKFVSQVIDLNQPLRQIDSLLAINHALRHQTVGVLRLEKQQYEVMEEAIIQRQFARIYAHIQQQYAPLIADLKAATVMGQIIRVLQRGRGYGFYDIASLTWFCITSFQLAAYFDTQPNIQKLLQYRQDIDWLLTRAKPADWQQAAKLDQPYSKSEEGPSHGG